MMIKPTGPGLVLQTRIPPIEYFYLNHFLKEGLTIKMYNGQFEWSSAGYSPNCDWDDIWIFVVSVLYCEEGSLSLKTTKNLEVSSPFIHSLPLGLFSFFMTSLFVFTLSKQEKHQANHHLLPHSETGIQLINVEQKKKVLHTHTHCISSV